MRREDQPESQLGAHETTARRREATWGRFTPDGMHVVVGFADGNIRKYGSLTGIER